ncbi:hypothetical protein HGRIS_014001 [Hohenbuehelia grisea]|uniref:Uncharacterized protein n=1 Tax=Hohenbuehelia grisea TaxID=104357 RepID=A0ABR3JS36_9AGAR
MSWCRNNIQERWDHQYAPHVVDKNGKGVLVLKSRFNNVWNWFSASELGKTVTEYWAEWYDRAADGRFVNNPSRPFPAYTLDEEHDINDVDGELLTEVKASSRKFRPNPDLPYVAGLPKASESDLPRNSLVSLLGENGLISDDELVVRKSNSARNSIVPLSGENRSISNEELVVSRLTDSGLTRGVNGSRNELTADVTSPAPSIDPYDASDNTVWVPDLRKAKIFGRRWIVSCKRTENLANLANKWKKAVFEMRDEHISDEGGMVPTIHPDDNFVRYGFDRAVPVMYA